MHRWLVLVPALLLAAPVGCQRLPDSGSDDDPPPSSDGGTTEGTFQATLLPGDEDTGGQDETGGSTSACDPVLQLGCADGQRCTAIISGGEVTYTCVPATGGLGPGEACVESYTDGLDACPSGYACLADEGGSGLCMPLCESHTDCAQGQCLPARESGIPYCADDCSPFEASCPSPLQCRRNDNRFSCTFPSTNDVGGPAAPCAIADDGGCAQGFVCVPGSLVPDCTTDNCCASLCDLDDGNTCPAPSTCTAVLQGPAPGFESIGACFVPA